MRRLFRLLIIVLLLLGIVWGIFFISKSKFNSASVEVITGQVRNLSLIKSNLVDIRINTVNLTKLDPNSVDFSEDREVTLNQIREANNNLKVSLEDYEKDKKEIKKLSLQNLVYLRLRKKYDLKQSLENISKTSSEIDSFVYDFEEVGNITKVIYGIYFPSDYEKYNIDFSGYYEGELKDGGIFTDVKDDVEGISNIKFKTRELSHRLEELQIIFDACLEKIGKESIAFKDLVACEDALSIQELKELAFYTELSYINTDSFLQTLADLTNEAYSLEFAISKMLGDLEK
jgi:hypothetical protein